MNTLRDDFKRTIRHLNPRLDLSLMSNQERDEVIRSRRYTIAGIAAFSVGAVIGGCADVVDPLQHKMSPEAMAVVELDPVMEDLVQGVRSGEITLGELPAGYTVNTATIEEGGTPIGTGIHWLHEQIDERGLAADMASEEGRLETELNVTGDSAQEYAKDSTENSTYSAQPGDEVVIITNLPETKNVLHPSKVEVAIAAVSADHVKYFNR